MSPARLPQVEIDELRDAIKEVLDGRDPLAFVNAFLRNPLEAPEFPQQYWLQRICAVAEMLGSAGKEQRAKIQAQSDKDQRPKGEAMLRYKLSPSEHKIRIWKTNDYEKGVPAELVTELYPAHLAHQGQHYFVDILDQTEKSYHLRIYHPDGTITLGWFPGKILDSLEIHDRDLLFDGRFNSDKINP